MQAKKLDVIILTYNRNELLVQVLDKLATQTINDFNVIITDDGSRDIINFQKYPFIEKYMWNKDDGYHRVKRLNEAIEECVSNKVLLLDDDCVPMRDDFLEHHCEALETKNVGVSLGLLRFPEGGTNRGWFGTANTAFTIETLLMIGGFDMGYDGHYGHEDQDLGKTISSKGIRTYQNDQAVAMHLGKMYKDGDRSESVIGHNTRYFREKWGCNPA